MTSVTQAAASPASVKFGGSSAGPTARQVDERRLKIFRGKGGVRLDGAVPPVHDRGLGIGHAGAGECGLECHVETDERVRGVDPEQPPVGSEARISSTDGATLVTVIVAADTLVLPSVGCWARPSTVRVEGPSRPAAENVTVDPGGLERPVAVQVPGDADGRLAVGVTGCQELRRGQLVVGVPVATVVHNVEEVGRSI